MNKKKECTVIKLTVQFKYSQSDRKYKSLLFKDCQMFYNIRCIIHEINFLKCSIGFNFLFTELE